MHCAICQMGLLLRSCPVIKRKFLYQYGDIWFCCKPHSLCQRSFILQRHDNVTAISKFVFNTGYLVLYSVAYIMAWFHKFCGCHYCNIQGHFSSASIFRMVYNLRFTEVQPISRNVRQHFRVMIIWTEKYTPFNKIFKQDWCHSTRNYIRELDLRTSCSAVKHHLYKL